MAKKNQETRGLWYWGIAIAFLLEVHLGSVRLDVHFNGPFIVLFSAKTAASINESQR